MTLGQMPGLGLSISVGGDAVLERGYGYADLARQEPMTEHTQVVIGSTTKALTAVAVLQLADRSLLRLDDRIGKHLPNFRLAGENGDTGITIRHALTHTAGLPPTPMNGPEFLFSDDVTDEAAQQFVAELATAEPVWPPGAGWLYANDGYVLVGRIIEAVSGMSYEQYMAENLFQPLGLQETWFPRRIEPSPETATPYDYGPDGLAYPSFFPHNRLSNAAGMLVSSAHDAGRWLRALLHGGSAGGKQIVSRHGLAEMMRPQASIPSGQRTSERGDTSYSLGWMVSTMDDMKVVAHGGSAITMGSQFSLIPERGLAVAAVANSSTEATAVIVEGVLRLMTGRAPERSFPSVQKSLEPDRSLWPRLAGVYQPLEPQNAVTSLLPVEVAGYGLRARTYPGDERRRPGDIHFVPTTNGLRFVLYGRGKTGSQAEFSIEGSTVLAELQGAALLKVASRLHSGTVALWRR